MLIFMLDRKLLVLIQILLVFDLILDIHRVFIIRIAQYRWIIKARLHYVPSVRRGGGRHRATSDLRKWAFIQSRILVLGEWCWTLIHLLA